ncbi:MAG: hypothetical protein LBE38_11740 [Deltaproteobacteria bacterium]|jgi:hypothetical protein|nr:hypothetical protein [Deltaproteobacteria bacterium]
MKTPKRHNKRSHNFQNGTSGQLSDLVLPGSATVDNKAYEKENDSETSPALQEAEIARLRKEIALIKKVIAIFYKQLALSKKITRIINKIDLLEAEKLDLKRQKQDFGFGEEQNHPLSSYIDSFDLKSEHFSANHKASPLYANNRIITNQYIDLYLKDGHSMKEFSILAELLETSKYLIKLYEELTKIEQQ